jgi:hypothetical protein
MHASQSTVRLARREGPDGADRGDLAVDNDVRGVEVAIVRALHADVQDVAALLDGDGLGRDRPHRGAGGQEQAGE